MEHRFYQGAELEKMTPAQLLEFSFYWNQKAGEDTPVTDQAGAWSNLVQHCMESASQEMEARWGAGSNDHLASYFTASHASYDDMIRMAAEMTDILVEVARNGEHDCGAHERDFSRTGRAADENGDEMHVYRCRCGRIWGRPIGGNTYFDPTNTTVEEVLASADRN